MGPAVFEPTWYYVIFESNMIEKTNDEQIDIFGFRVCISSMVY